MKSTKLLIALMFAFTFTVFAQQKEDFSNEPGFFDYSEYTQFKNIEPTTAVHLEGPMLKAIARMGENRSEKAAEMLASLKLVKVNEFPIAKGDLEKTEATIAAMDKKLQSLKWERIIKTKEKGMLASVYVKMDTNETYSGLFVIAMDKENDLTLVNIVGKIDLETIGNLSEQINLPGLSGKNKLEKKDK